MGGTPWTWVLPNDFDTNHSQFGIHCEDDYIRSEKMKTNPAHHEIFTPIFKFYSSVDDLVLITQKNVLNTLFHKDIFQNIMMTTGKLPLTGLVFKDFEYHVEEMIKRLQKIRKHLNDMERKIGRKIIENQSRAILFKKLYQVNPDNIYSLDDYTQGIKIVLCFMNAVRFAKYYILKRSQIAEITD